VQVDPVKSKMKPPGTKRLKLNCDILLSTFAFQVSLRRYTTAAAAAHGGHGARAVSTGQPGAGPYLPNSVAMHSVAVQAGAYTRPLFRST
jgi:hypothetical protein